MAAGKTSVKSLVGREDIRWYDGTDSYFERSTSTGGKLTLTKVGSVVDVCAVYGSGSDMTSAAINEAIRNIGNDKAMLVLSPGTWSLTSSVTIPTNIGLSIPFGAIIDINAYNLSCNGPFEAGLYQVFNQASTGAVTFGNGAVSYCHPEWWGAVADGTTDDTAKIQDAIDAVEFTASVVVFCGGTYATTGISVFPGSTLEFRGATTNPISNYKQSCLKMTGSTGFVIRTADGGGSYGPPTGGIKGVTLIQPQIDMDSKGDCGIMLEAAWVSLISRPHVYNIPTGTYSYDDGSSYGSQTYYKSGIALKGIYGVSGCYSNMLQAPYWIRGQSASIYGQCGILLTSSTPTSGTKANHNNILGQGYITYCTIGIHVENGNDNLFQSPDCSNCTTGIRDDSTRTTVEYPYLENCSIGIDGRRGTNLSINGLGSVASTDDVYLGGRDTNYVSDPSNGTAIEPYIVTTSGYSKVSSGGWFSRARGIKAISGSRLGFYTYAALENIDNGPAVDASDGYVDIPITGHTLAVGDWITISGATASYNGGHKVMAISANAVRLAIKYVAETFSGAQYRRQVERASIDYGDAHAIFNLDQPTDAARPTMLKWARAGATYADIEAAFPASSTYENCVIGITPTASNPGGCYICTRSGDGSNTFRWVPMNVIFSTVNCSNPPTNSEMIAEFGAAADRGPGWRAIIDDAGAHANCYLVWSDGTKYWQVTATACA